MYPNHGGVYPGSKLMYPGLPTSGGMGGPGSAGSSMIPGLSAPGLGGPGPGDMMGGGLGGPGSDWTKQLLAVVSQAALAAAHSAPQSDPESIRAAVVKATQTAAYQLPLPGGGMGGVGGYGQHRGFHGGLGGGGPQIGGLSSASMASVLASQLLPGGLGSLNGLDLPLSMTSALVDTIRGVGVTNRYDC